MDALKQQLASLAREADVRFPDGARERPAGEEAITAQPMKPRADGQFGCGAAQPSSSPGWRSSSAVLPSSRE